MKAREVVLSIFGLALLAAFCVAQLDSSPAAGPVDKAATNATSLLPATTNPTAADNAQSAFRLAEATKLQMANRLVSVNGTNGVDPTGPLRQDSAGNLYGVTQFANAKKPEPKEENTSTNSLPEPSSLCLIALAGVLAFRRPAKTRA